MRDEEGARAGGWRKTAAVVIGLEAHRDGFQVPLPVETDFLLASLHHLHHHLHPLQL